MSAQIEAVRGVAFAAVEQTEGVAFRCDGQCRVHKKELPGRFIQTTHSFLAHKPTCIIIIIGVRGPFPVYRRFGMCAAATLVGDCYVLVGELRSKKWKGRIRPLEEPR